MTDFHCRACHRRRWLGRLEESGLAVVRSESAGSRAKKVFLTAKGQRAQIKHRLLVWSIEKRWQEPPGKQSISALRKSLERIVGEPTEKPSPLFRGLERHAGGWRASGPRPTELPHYPMILHRGGFPDGS